MINRQIEKLAIIIKKEDLKKYAGEAFFNLIQAVVNQDCFSGITALQNVKDLIFHMPTILFWDKMKRFLCGTYRNFEEQIKMANRFNGDDEKYVEFVKKQVNLINEIDEDTKIDFYAALTRCFLLSDLETSLYFKLAKYLVMCTSYELEFMKEMSMDDRCHNSAMVSILYHYGLFEQNTDEKTIETYYVLSSFGKALKGCSLNYDDTKDAQLLLSYDSLVPLNIPEPITMEDIDLSMEEIFGEETP